MSNHLYHKGALDPNHIILSSFIYYNFRCIQVDGLHRPNFMMAWVCVTGIRMCWCLQMPQNSLESAGIWNRWLASLPDLPAHIPQVRSSLFRWRHNPRVLQAVNGTQHRNVIAITVPGNTMWLIEKWHRNVMIITHNALGNHTYLLYRHFTRNRTVPELMFNGRKTMYIRQGKGLNIWLLQACQQASDLRRERRDFCHFFPPFWELKQGISLTSQPHQSKERMKCLLTDVLTPKSEMRTQTVTQLTQMVSDLGISLPKNFQCLDKDALIFQLCLGDERVVRVMWTLLEKTCMGFRHLMWN